MRPSVLFCFFAPLQTEVFSDGPEERRTTVTLIISLRWDSGSRPAMGRILIFCVLEQRSARDSVIFLWVALSVEWGLEIQETPKVRFKVTVHKCFLSTSLSEDELRSKVKATVTPLQPTACCHNVSKTSGVNFIRCGTNVTSLYKHVFCFLLTFQ